MTHPSPILGAHMSIAPGFVAAARKATSVYGASALQLFCKSPRGRGVTKLTSESAAEFRAFSEENDLRFVIVHGSYLLNLAKPVSNDDPWPIDSLVADLRSAESLGGAGVVLHTGKTLTLPYEEAEDFLVENLKRVLDATADLKAHILLENMSGQGTEMGVSFEQLASILDKLGRPERVSICFDTCHAFAGGYDLRTADSIKKVLADFDRLIGLDRITVFHFNDSKKGLGENRDRHEVLEVGQIGNGLKLMAQWARDHEVPMILETPEKDGRTHADDLAILKGWLA